MAEKTFHSITLPGQDTARVPLTAAEFSTSVAYNVKDYCTYQGKLYRCTTAHAAGAWNAAHFTETDIDAEFDRKLDIPISQANAPTNPRVGDLWIDNDENSPIYNVDASPTLNSTNAVQSGGTKVALNSLDSRKMEHGVITGDFSASVDYRIGDLVFYATTANGITTRTLYRCTTDHNSATWNAAHFTATTLEVELQRVRDNEADTDMIGDLFGTKTTYAVGDYCIYNDNLYRCIQAVDNTGVATPAFDPDDWMQVALANDVSDLNSTLNNIESSLGRDINTKSIWELGAVKPGASGGTIVSNNKTIVTTNMISDDLEFNIVKDGFYFVVALYASDGIWKGFYNESDGTPTTDWYNGKQLTSISYADILDSFPNYKIRIQIKNTSNIYLISTDDYDALTMTTHYIYTKDQTDILINGCVKKQQSVSDAGKALVINSSGQVEPGDVSIDIDATLTQTGKAADAKATGDAIMDATDDLSRGIANITGNIVYTWIKGGKIRTGSAIININPEPDENYCYAIIPCVSDDSFWIVASGEYSYRQWVFIDNSKNRLSQKPNADPITSPIEITAPENAAYLVVNSLISADHLIYKDEPIISKVGRNNDIAKNINGIIWESGNINNNGQESAGDRYIRSQLPLYFAAGTHISCGVNNHFYIIKYTNDYKFDSIIARNARDYTLETDGLYRFTIELGNITAALLSAYIPHNNLLLFGNKQSYVKETADAINYISTQNTPFRITDSTVKMAHDSSIVFDGNVMWIAYYCDETTYEEALTNTTTYIEIKKVNPYTREIISSATFKVGDSIGEYTQMTDAPYIPKLNVYDDYILVYFLGYDEATSEVMIASFRVDKNTLAFSNFAPCILKDINGVAHKLNCTGLSDVYYSYTGTQVSTSIIGFTTQAQKYNGYWYNTVNTVFSGSMNTMFIKSADGIVWTVERVMDVVGVANEASFVIKDGYVYVAARSGACLVRYSMDTTDETYAKTEIPLAIELKTAMVIFEGRIILGDNIDVVTVPSESNNRKNFGLFEVDPQTLNIKLLSRIITQQGMHYPAFAVGNNELWMSWSNDYTFASRMSQRTNIAISKIIV